MNDKVTPKYMNSPETNVYFKGKNLYALNFAKELNEKQLIIVEGYMDVVSLHQYGIKNSVASLGTALTEMQGRLLKKYCEEVIISYDADTAGQAATLRGLDILNAVGCKAKVLLIPDKKDPDEFIKKYGPKGFKKLIDNSLNLVEYKIKVLKEQIDTSDEEGKIIFLNSVADILAGMDNQIEQDVYMKKIAKEYGIRDYSLNSEVQKKVKSDFTMKKNFDDIEKKIGRAIRENLEKKAADDGIKYYERLIITLLCHDNSIYYEIKAKLLTDDFIDEGNKNLLQIIFERLDSNNEFDFGALLNIISEDEIGLFTRIYQEKCNYDDNKKAAFDFIKNIKQLKLNKRQNEIIEILKKLDNQDIEESNKLKKELLEIVLKKKRICMI